jgi:hypothetical protein
VWSYSGDPSSSVRDAVRFEIQDTNPKAHLLENEEIDYAVTQEAPSETPSQSEVLSAAARCMEALARLFRMQADTEVGSLRVEYAKQAAGYDEQAVKTRLRAQGLHAPWAGGLSRAEKEAWRDDTNLTQPAFRKHLFHNPWAGASTPGILSGGLIQSENEVG